MDIKPKKINIAVIGGDGIGPEVIAEGIKVLHALNSSLNFTFECIEYDIGSERFLRTQEILPESVFHEIRDNCDVIFLGALGDPRVQTGILERGILLELRSALDLYINLRPCHLYLPELTPLERYSKEGDPDIHFTVVRENTEGAYAGIGGFLRKNTSDEVAIQEDINTRKGVERCIRFAYRYCQNNSKRQQLTLVDKANVLTYAHDLWRRTFSVVGKEYPDIRTDCQLVDSVVMDLVRQPDKYDLIVTNNMFGDIITDLGAVISGGLGIASSANINMESPYRCKGLFEPVHGSAPDIAGKREANPIAAILSLKMLFDFLGDQQASDKVYRSVMNVIKEAHSGKLKTAQIGEKVCHNL